MEEQTLISIITPTFNSEKYIEDTLTSINSQSYKNIEHIIVDNNSTDNTEDICKRYTNTFIKKKDNGMYEALNTGIENSNGEYLMFINSDDMLSEIDTIENIVKEIKKTGHPDVLYGKTTMVDENGKYIYTHKPKKVLTSDIANKRILVIIHQSQVIARSMFERYGKYDTHLKNMADCEFILRIMNSKARFTFMDATLSKFRRHAGNISDAAKLSGRKKTEISYIINKLSIANVSHASVHWYFLLDGILNIRYVFFILGRAIRNILKSGK